MRKVRKAVNGAVKRKRAARVLAQPRGPEFIVDTIIDKQCLLIDSLGVAWWIDPFTQSVQRATFIEKSK